MKKLLSAFMLITVLFLTANANTVTIWGQISHADPFSPYLATHVILYNATTQTSQVAITSPFGYYVFYGVDSDGAYTITPYAKGSWFFDPEEYAVTQPQADMEQSFVYSPLVSCLLCPYRSLVKGKP